MTKQEFRELPVHVQYLIFHGIIRPSDTAAVNATIEANNQGDFK